LFQQFFLCIGQAAVGFWWGHNDIGIHGIDPGDQFAFVQISWGDCSAIDCCGANIES